MNEALVYVFDARQETAWLWQGAVAKAEKSTLLNIIAGFEPLSGGGELSGGELWLDGENTSSGKDPQWSRFRHQKIGVNISWTVTTLTPLNVKQNIAFPSPFKSTKMGHWWMVFFHAGKMEALGISELTRYGSMRSLAANRRPALA